mmetsp:Transcript_51417/g.155756  ORF Transcript_51417/g.155756 Transcript_51417/m.155756 type:complete len:80 (-) Transcript_51417:22-261(-)
MQAPHEKAEEGRPPLSCNTGTSTRTLLQEAQEEVERVARPRTTSKRAQSQKGCASARGRHLRIATAGMQEFGFGVLPVA